jgi:flagellar hook-associated protein 2
MATSMISALGAGSGVDVQTLAEGLVEAERLPREAAIKSKIDTQERRIAGYSAVMLSLENVKKTFQKLNDLNDFNAATVSNSQPTVLSAATTSAAAPGRHTVEVLQLAQAQRSASNAFSSKVQVLNGGAAFSVQLSVGSDQKTSVRVSDPTPQGVVDAINAAGQGVTARLVDTGDKDNPYTIALSGAIGADNAYSFTTDDGSGTGQTDTFKFSAATTTGTIRVAGVAVSVTAGQTAAEVTQAVKAALEASSFMVGVPGRAVADGAGSDELTLQWAATDGLAVASYADSDATGVGMTVTTDTAHVAGASVVDLNLEATTLQIAQDAQVKVNGLSVTRSANNVDDVIPGVYIDLMSANAGAPLDLRITRDTTAIKENLQAAVEAYNVAVSDFDILAGERSSNEDDLYSGSLPNDSFLRSIKSQLRTMFMSESSTASGPINAFRDLGLDIDRQGVLSLDKTKLDAALNNNFDDVVKAFSANTNNQSEFSVGSRGIAGDAIKAINDLIGARSALTQQSQGAQTRIDDYTDKLDALELRMTALLTRYTKQFGAMEALVGQSNTMRESLKSTFEGMMSVYTKK